MTSQIGEQTMRQALEMALDALLHAYHNDEAHHKTLDTITAIKEALAQAEQEPTASTDTQYSGNGTAGIQNETKPTGFFFQIPKLENNVCI